MVFRWRADDGPTSMLAWQLCDFQGIMTTIAKKLYMFVIFQGGPDHLPPSSLSGSAHRIINGI